MSDPLATDFLIAQFKRQEEEANAARQRADNEQNELPSLPTLSDLCINSSLYAPVQTENRLYLDRILTEDGQFDAFCVYCKNVSIFKYRQPLSVSIDTKKKEWMLQSRDFVVQAQCQRSNHIYKFNFRFDGSSIIKFGQYPSIEDIKGADIDKYRSVMSNQYYRELKRATGLASHGIGIGAFVYLRRIFENLVQSHYDTHQERGADIKDFSSMRMDEKIQALRSVLPTALYKHRSAYKILSKGIHELNEDQCSEFFPVLRSAIISILEQDLQAQEKLKIERELEQAVSDISGKI